MLTLSEIKGTLPSDYKDIIFIDDPEVVQAINEYQNSKILKKESERLEEHAKNILTKKLIERNIKRATTGTKNLRIAPVTKSNFDITKFREENPNAYNMYLKSIFYNKYTITEVELDK